MPLKAVFFDLHGTLCFVPSPLSEEEVSDFLVDRGVKIYPQSWRAAHHYVAMIDYPKHGYENWLSFIRQILYRLEARIDDEILLQLTKLFEERDAYHMYPDAVKAIMEAKNLGLKTAVITTIGSFRFQKALKPVKERIDLVVDGYTARCEKSNPEMIHVALRKLELQPEEAVMIGDELLVDIRIPKKVGLKTIFLDRKNMLSHKPKEADAKVSTLVQAMEIIKSWPN